MYTLRTISQNGIQNNLSIGNWYSVVTRDTNYEQFCFHFKECFDRDHVADCDEQADSNTRNVIAFVNSEGSQMPIYKTDQNYIMTESGKTFSKIN